MFFARSASNGGEKEPISNHLYWVSLLAESFATAWSSGEEAAITGRLHDIGKYGDLFQDVLNHQATHVDHWTVGAYLAAKNLKVRGRAAALAIEGHHEGLQKADKTLQDRLIMSSSRSHSGHSFSGKSGELEQRWMADGGTYQDVTFNSVYMQNFKFPVAAMLDVRMLFSALVDADYLSAEAYEKSGMTMDIREAGPLLKAEEHLQCVLNYVNGIAQTAKASKEILSIRSDLLQACLKIAEGRQGPYTLAAPTGSGKTLAMLAFALKHAQTHGLRRIIMVLPYLSILDQTVDVYRKILCNAGIDYVLEDDSLARDVGQAEGNARLLAQNWDAPIIVTTTIRFFESLFSNRPVDCRKLHRIANSIVLFDEAQTLPPLLAAPTIAALSHLIRQYNCSVVFSTATQPAFESIADTSEKLCGVRWQPSMVAADELGLFRRARRVDVHYEPIPQSWESIAAQINNESQAIAIVNMKRHARLLFDLVNGNGLDGAIHLSTSMCPQHRRNKLQTVHQRLKAGMICRLISTQCVEAGVDLDFPALWRALAPLDSLCQAAGRCNRNGSPQMGRMTVFSPEQTGNEKLYPDDSYEIAAKLVYEMYATSGWPDIFDPAVIKEYYLMLYNRQRNIVGMAKAAKEIEDAIIVQDFPEVSKLYSWIHQYASNIIVPYSGAMDLYNSLSEAAFHGGINAAWFTQARKITVGETINTDSVDSAWLRPVKKGREVVDGWYILLPGSGLYNDETGLDMGSRANNFAL